MARSQLAGPAGPVPDRNRVSLIRTEQPFRGYRPSLNPAFGDLGTASTMSNLIIRNGALTWDYGWSKYQSAGQPLPLGGYTINFPGATGGSPILLLDWYADNLGSGNEATIAVTSKTAANGPGNLFYYPHSGAAVWTSLVDFPGGVGFATDETHVMDSAYYPYSYMAGVGTPPRGHYFVTNGVRDTANARVIAYPGTGAGNYITMPTPAANPSLSGGGNPFGCRSLATQSERLYALNTYENGIRQPKRLRWTRPGFSGVGATIWQSSTGQGAGAQDLFLVPGEGVAARPIGRNLVCYFDEGACILSYTGQMRPHLALAYATSQRGLVGTRAVADLGGGVHWGVFTDGFWFLTENGQWNESGIATEGGLRYRKFTDYFFESLYKPYAYRIVCGYNPERRQVTVTWPSSASVWQTWIYDIDLDEMYPQSYAALSGLGTTLQTGQAFLSCPKGIANSGSRSFLHATRNGYIWEHIASSSLRNASSVNWSYTTHNVTPGNPFDIYTQLFGWIDVSGLGTPPITWQSLDPFSSVLSSVAKTPSTTMARQQMRFPIHQTYTGSVQHSLSGTHPVMISGIGTTVERIGEVP